MIGDWQMGRRRMACACKGRHCDTSHDVRHFLDVVWTRGKGGGLNFVVDIFLPHFFMLTTAMTNIDDELTS